jgi:hypothetical protein
LGQARQRKLAGLPPRAKKPAPASPVPQDEQSYEVIVCAIVNDQLKIGREADDLDLKKFMEGATYTNAFRVYSNGFITPKYSIKPKSGVEDDATRQFQSGTRRFQKYLTEQFDTMYPETGEMAQKFVQIFTERVNGMKAATTDGLLDNAKDVVVTESEQFNEEFLNAILTGIEAEYLRTGTFQPLLGWGLTPDLVAMFEIGLQSWKYRHARAISEVAKNVGAKYLVFVNDGWVRDPKTGKRNGKDALTASIISPDATVLYSVSGTYLNKNGKIQVVEPIHGSKVDHRTEQRLFPAWTAVN